MKKVCILLVVISYTYHNVRFKNREMHLYSFFYLRARRGGWLTPRPSHFTPGKLLVRTVKGVGLGQGRSGQVRITSPPPGFEHCVNALSTIMNSVNFKT